MKIRIFKITLLLYEFNKSWKFVLKQKRERFLDLTYSIFSQHVIQRFSMPKELFLLSDKSDETIYWLAELFIAPPWVCFSILYFLVWMVANLVNPITEGGRLLCADRESLPCYRVTCPFVIYTLAGQSLWISFYLANIYMTWLCVRVLQLFDIADLTFWH